MANRHAKRTLVGYYSSVIATYGVTLLFACYLFTPFGWFVPEPVYSQVAIEPAPAIPQTPIKPLQMGKPVRVVVASLAIDLPIEDGVYNPADQSWSLTEKKAHYALPSVLANDRQGNTLIYGHYNQYVFYTLKDIKPGAVAQVYTDNGYIFSYVFVASANVKPDDVSVFRYGGGPTLTLQTCSGRWYETRQLFSFVLQKVER